VGPLVSLVTTLAFGVAGVIAATLGAGVAAAVIGWLAAHPSSIS
jgi:hypothetical protein